MSSSASKISDEPEPLCASLAYLNYNPSTALQVADELTKLESELRILDTCIAQYSAELMSKKYVRARFGRGGKVARLLGREIPHVGRYEALEDGYSMLREARRRHVTHIRELGEKLARMRTKDEGLHPTFPLEYPRRVHVAPHTATHTPPRSAPRRRRAPISTRPPLICTNPRASIIAQSPLSATSQRSRRWYGSSPVGVSPATVSPRDSSASPSPSRGLPLAQLQTGFSLARHGEPPPAHAHPFACERSAGTLRHNLSVAIPAPSPATSRPATVVLTPGSGGSVSRLMHVVLEELHEGGYMSPTSAFVPDVNENTS